MIGEHAIFSRKSDEWATPQGIFDDLNREFHFTLDACADADNAKCINYFSKYEDAISKNWGGISFSAIPHTAR